MMKLYKIFVKNLKNSIPTILMILILFLMIYMIGEIIIILVGLKHNFNISQKEKFEMKKELDNYSYHIIKALFNCVADETRGTLSKVFYNSSKKEVVAT